MRKVLILVIFTLIGMNITFAQNRYDVTSRVKASEIKNKELQDAFINFQKRSFLKLPIHLDLNYFQFNDSIPTLEQRRQWRETTPWCYRDSSSPFYVNLDRRDKTRDYSETRITLFKETNGDYIWGIVSATSPSRDIIKDWLVTFDFSGKIIDYLLVSEWPGIRSRIAEAQTNKDFTVNVQRLDFPDNDYIIRDDSIKMDRIYVDNLRGQRIDSKYQITPEGKFKKMEEIRYQPQIYTPEILLEGCRIGKENPKDIIFIRQRKEKRL